MALSVYQRAALASTRQAEHVADQAERAEDGAAKLSDFGLARPAAPEASRITRTGEVLGAPCYLAPEQVLGLSSSKRTAPAA